jgi:hypothetical protein
MHLYTKRTTQHIDDAIDISMTGDLCTQPWCKSQICKAAHYLNQNIGKQNTHPRRRISFCSIHTAKATAVAGSDTGNLSND